MIASDIQLALNAQNGSNNSGRTAQAVSKFRTPAA